MSIIDINNTVVMRIPAEVSVGDEFDVLMVARVVAIRESMIDVTSMAGPEEWIPGERVVSLYLRQKP